MALNSTASANAPGNSIHQDIPAGRAAAPALGRKSQPSNATSCEARMLPKVSFISTVIAPAKRALPDASCWSASSLMALVSIMPGISTISAEMTTGCTLSGASRLATNEASRVARNAAIASTASCRRGRRSP